MKCNYPEESPYCAFHYNGICTRDHNYECPALMKKPMENLSHGEMVQIAEEKRCFPPDYIDRRKLTAEMRKLIPTRLYTEEDMLDLVNEQPRADVVEIVLCKNCKWYSRYCGCDKINGLVGANEDSYCSRGELKEKTDAEK